jgi:hypothetical protein
VFIDENRVLEQPAASTAISETAASLVFEKAISTSVGAAYQRRPIISCHHQTGEGGQISA